MRKDRVIKLSVAVLVCGCLAVIHWSRNRWNAPVAAIDDVAGWTELTAEESLFHRMGAGNESNRKFVSPDGHSEAIFRPDHASGQPALVTESLNMGTYNLFGPRFLRGALHGVFDVLPYFLLGNAPTDMFNLARFRALLDTTIR